MVGPDPREPADHLPRREQEARPRALTRQGPQGRGQAGPARPAPGRVGDGRGAGQWRDDGDGPHGHECAQPLALVDDEDLPAGPEQAPVHGEPGEGAHVELGADGVAQAVEDPDPGQLGLGEIRAGGGELGPPLRVEAALQVCQKRVPLHGSTPSHPRRPDKTRRST